MYEPQLKVILTEAISRVYRDMEKFAPAMASQVLAWTKQLPESQQQADYFTHPRAYPFLLFPWWLEKSLHEEPDASFQADLAYSSVNAYYYIRLFDNLMDNTATVEARLLPASVFFHFQLQYAYQGLFAHNHPFWEFFIATWLRMSEATIQDMDLDQIDEAAFTQVVSQKVCAAKIPVAAVCYKYDRPHLIEPWSKFIDLFGCWHVMQEDLFDWREDLQKGIKTYFLSQAERCKHEQESAAAWVIREGFDWGIATLTTWMNEMQALAADLNSPDLTAYLANRQAALIQQREKMDRGMAMMKKLLEVEARQHGD